MCVDHKIHPRCLDSINLLAFNKCYILDTNVHPHYIKLTLEKDSRVILESAQASRLQDPFKNFAYKIRSFKVSIMSSSDERSRAFRMYHLQEINQCRTPDVERNISRYSF